MTKASNINQSANPCIELIQTNHGPMWEVTGLGMMSQHKQLWQAMLRFDCMCIAKGIDPGEGYERVVSAPGTH
jgi:hypothetical protein